MTRFVFVLIAIALFCQSAPAQDCVLRKDQDSIKVFTCHTEGSKFKSIKAYFSIDATYDELEEMILDINNYTKWQYNTIESKILKPINDNEFIYYSQISAPWPVTNRDMVVHLKKQQQAGTKNKLIITNGEPDFIPHNPDLVRVPSSKAMWVIKEERGGKLSVAYSIEIDPGGSVPAWMVNMVCAEAPYVSFKNLKEQMRRKKNGTLKN